METSAWLRDLGVREPHGSTLYLSAPWGALSPGSGGHPGMYLAASGTATITVAGSETIALEAGDVAILPRGSPHAIASRPDLAVISVEEFCSTASVSEEGHVVGGGGGPLTELRTLCFRVEGSTARAVTEFAPPLVVLRARDARPWLSHVVRATLDLVDEAARAPEIATLRLGELLLLEGLAGSVLAPSALTDSPVMRAMLLLRSDLSRRWTVRALARRVGLSRSTLHDRFVRALGCSPGAYLLRARMEEAAILLARGDSIDDVAARVGYGWPSSFAVAFRRFHGVAPSRHKNARHIER